jgi:hypothetical protein
VEELNFYAGDCPSYVSKPNHVSSYQEQRSAHLENIPKRVWIEKPRANKAVTGCRPLLKKVMHSMKLSDEEIKQVLGSDDELDFIIATVIVHCPNLKVLRLGVDFLHQNTFLPKALYHFLGLTGSSKSALTKLENVDLTQNMLRPEDGYSRPSSVRVPFSVCLPFFYVPRLKTFSVVLPDRIGNFRPRLPPAEWPTWPTTTPPTCTVSVLDLKNTIASAATLSFILAQTPRLKSLRYNIWVPLGSQHGAIELRDALYSVSQTLEELVISSDAMSSEEEDATIDWNSRRDEGEGLGSLVPLSHLTKLEISLPLLLNWTADSDLSLKDVLPSGLEELCFRDDCVGWSMEWNEERTVEEVQRWVENKAWKKCTPVMRRVGLRLCDSTGQEWAPKWRKKLINICEKEDLEFWFEKRHHDLEQTAEGTYERVDNPLRYPL